MPRSSLPVPLWSGLFVVIIVASAVCSGDTGRTDGSVEVLDSSTVKDSFEAVDSEEGAVALPDSSEDVASESGEDADGEAPDAGPEKDDAPSCDCLPPSVSVTVNDIPASMNGSGPYMDNEGAFADFRLALPVSGFVWELSIDCPCGCDVDGLEAWVGAKSDENLASFFQTDGKGDWTWTVEDGQELPEMDGLELQARVTDGCGQASQKASLTVRTVEMTTVLDPFDLEDPWLLTYSRDFYSITWAMDLDGNVVLEALEGGNGIPDFLEDLWTIGMGTPNPTDDFDTVTCEGVTGGNECLARLLLGMVRERMYPMFERQPDGTPLEGSVNIRFLLEGEPGAPDPAGFVYQFLDGTETVKSFSMIGFGGGNLAADYVGMSESLDRRNVRNENNAKKDYGVMTTSLIRYFYQLLFADPSILDLAQLFLGDLLPTLGGIPMGEKAGDDRAVDMAVPDGDLAADVLDRRQKMLAALELVCGGLAALTSHEIGHSLGLVPYGHPPYGFFADEKKADFIENPAGSIGPHIDTTGQNLMQAGPGSGNLPPMSIGFLMSPWFFNELNLAYLQGRVVLLPED